MLRHFFVEKNEGNANSYFFENLCLNPNFFLPVNVNRVKMRDFA